MQQRYFGKMSCSAKMFRFHVTQKAAILFFFFLVAILGGLTKCACLCVCVCVCPFTMKVSSVWNSWNVRKQINNVVLKALLPLPSPFFVTLE